VKTTNIVLMGYGRVGQAFVRLLQEKRQTCHKRYGLNPLLCAVFTSRGGVFLPPKKKAVDILSDFNPGAKPGRNIHWKTDLTLTEALMSFDPGAWVDCTPSNLRDGKPALGYSYQALDAGWHVITANKGPLTADFLGLWKKACLNRLSLGMSGATAAALPTLDVALRALAGSEILGIEGILNGTTNYILTRMEEGMDYAVALKNAQKKGIAEPDPSQDIEGWDTAAKILIIANALFLTGYTLADVRVEGISEVAPDLLLEARKAGKSVKLLGRMSRNSGEPELETKVTLLDSSHPLFSIDEARKGIVFYTDTMDSVTVTGGKSDARGAAAALLKDIINIEKGQI
jgi:homoserine dehydrogenase